MSSITGQDEGEGFGVKGISTTGEGVHGETSSNLATAIFGQNNGTGTGPGVVGIGPSTGSGAGVVGTARSNDGAGIVGLNQVGRRVLAPRPDNPKNQTNPVGVLAISKEGEGVHGETSSNFDAAVAGFNRAGVSVPNPDDANRPSNPVGVLGLSTQGEGVHGESSSPVFAGLAGINTSDKGIGVFAKGGRLAASFEGDVEVTGDIRLTNADFAEDFDIAEAESVEPGTVMVVTKEGALKPSQQSYDKRVAGVISGAERYRPAIILDRQNSQGKRMPLALVGKVYCKADAQSSPIDVGDLLTTSNTPGHAMKATDQHKAFGAVIGKALCPLESGIGLIPILIALQ